MRNAFAQELTRCAAENDSVVLLSGDIGNRLFDDFKRVAPDRFYNCGVAEANMTGVAAGMAMNGFHPVTYTITPFATTRCLEQIRVDLCYHNLPAIIAGTGSGLSYAELGPTHHSCEDIGMLRLLPNMAVVCPADACEVKLALREAFKRQGPLYLRLGKKGEPRIHDTEPHFEIGRSITVRPGNDLCILATGNAVKHALDVADDLRQQRISVRVESFHTVKPLDVELLQHAVKTYPLLVTMEEHSLIGGLGSAVAEWLADNPAPVRLQRFGTADRFPETVGSQEYVRNLLGLSRESMVARLVSEMKGIA